MYVYRAFDTSDMTNKSLKCSLMYWFELFPISFDTFDMVLYYIRTTLQDTMHHAAWPFDTSDIPWILQSCFSCKPVFGGNFLLIFPIIYQIVDQNLALWCLLTMPWIPELSSFNWFGGKNEQFSQFAHRFQRDQTCLAFGHLRHWNYSKYIYCIWSDHA